jgi:hypothetical protein
MPEPGICYVGDLTCGRDLVLQLEAVVEDDAVTFFLLDFGWGRTPSFDSRRL